MICNKELSGFQGLDIFLPFIQRRVFFGQVCDVAKVANATSPLS
jgi:hypothetical protein